MGVSMILSNFMEEIIWMVNQAVTLWPANPTPTHCSDVLFRLLALPSQTQGSPLVASVSESCRLAMVILMFLPYKNEYPSPKLMINVQLHKFKTALDIMLSLASPDHALLPWLLSVGGVCSSDPERKWVSGHLVSVVSDMDINAWGEMKSHLVKVIWSDLWCEEPFRESWEEVKSQRDILDNIDIGP
jgi:hypothetical protein